MPSVHDDDPADESLANLTKILVDKNRSLLEENQIDIEIFQSLEIEEQYEVIDQLQRMRRDIVRERMAAVQEDLNEFSAL